MGWKTSRPSGRAKTVHARKSAGKSVVCRAAHGETEGGPRAVETPRRMPESIFAPAKLHRCRGKSRHRRPFDAGAENARSRRVAGLSEEADWNARCGTD